MGSDLGGATKYRDRSNYASARESMADRKLHFRHDPIIVPLTISYLCLPLNLETIARARVANMQSPRVQSGASGSTTTSNLMLAARQAIDEEVEVRKSRRHNDTSGDDLEVPNMSNDDLASTPRPRSADLRAATSTTQERTHRDHESTPLINKSTSFAHSVFSNTSGSGPRTAFKFSDSRYKSDTFGAPDVPTISINNSNIPSSRQSQVPLPNSLSVVSKALTDIGLPPLHPCLLYAPTIRYPSSSPLSEKQQDALKELLSGLLSDVERKEQVVQTLLTRLNDVEEKSQKWEDRAWLTEQQRMEDIGVDVDVIDSLKVLSHPSEWVLWYGFTRLT